MCTVVLSGYYKLSTVLSLFSTPLPTKRAAKKLDTMSSDIPSSCRAVVIEKAGAPWTIKDVPVSAPQAGEVLVKVSACGICHSDVFLQQGHFGEGVFPRIPGHEVIGTVVAVGEGEKKWKVGDRIGGGWHGGHDGLCKACNRGLFQICDKGVVNGVSRDGGCKWGIPMLCSHNGSNTVFCARKIGS